MHGRLIVNADGFGFTRGINRGILETGEHGIVTSTSCVTNFAAIDELPLLVRRCPRMSVGVHMNLSVGAPVLPAGEVPSLVDERGQFWRHELPRRLLTGRISLPEMEKELSAQVCRVRDQGITPTHWDGHQNKHLYPPFLFAAMQVARRHGITRMRTHRRYLLGQRGGRRWRLVAGYYLRNPRRLLTHATARIATIVSRAVGFHMADRLITPGYVDHSTKAMLATWLALVHQMPPGTSEVYCHPGYPDDLLRQHAVYVDERRREVEILTSAELRHAVAECGVDLISFHDI